MNFYIVKFILADMLFLFKMISDVKDIMADILHVFNHSTFIVM